MRPISLWHYLVAIYHSLRAISASISCGIDAAKEGRRERIYASNHIGMREMGKARSEDEVVKRIR
jgi:hypothetical protein